MLSLLFKSRVKQHQRTSHMGKIETVKEHERLYQPKTGAACSCKPGQARDNCRQCEGTGQVIDFAAIRARPLEHEEVSGSEACPACGNPEATELGSLGSKYWVRCRGCGSDYVHTSQDDLDHDLGPDDMQKAKSLVLTFGKSVVKQHSRKTKTGKTSTVRQYSDKRTKKPAQDKDDQSTWSDSSRKQAAPKGVEITNVGSVDRHRNGMGGKPFSIVKFSYLEPGSEEEQQMVAMVFDEPGAIAVFDQDKLAAGDTSFGSNSWRGDQFEQPLREHIERHTKDLYGHLSEPKSEDAGDEGETWDREGKKKIKVSVPPREMPKEKADSDRAMDDDHKRQDANVRKPAGNAGDKKDVDIKAFMRSYRRNEGQNKHTANILKLAEAFGDAEQIALAKKGVAYLEEHGEQDYALSTEMYEKIHEPLWKKAQALAQGQGLRPRLATREDDTKQAGPMKKGLALLFGKARVRQHQRQGPKGKIETVTEHDRSDQPHAQTHPQIKDEVHAANYRGYDIYHRQVGGKDLYKVYRDGKFLGHEASLLEARQLVTSLELDSENQEVGEDDKRPRLTGRESKDFRLRG